MSTAMTIAAGIVGAVFLGAGFIAWHKDGELGYATFLGIPGAALFGAAAFDLITTFA